MLFSRGGRAGSMALAVLLLASMTVLAAPAAANPRGGVDAEVETDTNDLGEVHTITATVYDEFGVPFEGHTQVRFEFFAGSPSDPANDAGNTAATPDRTCTTSYGSTCSISYTQTHTAGTDLICVWTNAAPSLANDNTDGTCNGEGLNDGDDAAGQADPPAPANDDTDVVQKVWRDPQQAPTRVSCAPETESNPTGTAHTVTCTVTNSLGSVSGANVDVEATGPNDPDASNSPSDPDFTCTTNARGTCTFTQGPEGTMTPGTTLYRAWLDSDSSNSTTEADTTEGRDEALTPGATAEPDGTEVVNKVWVQEGQESAECADGADNDRDGHVDFPDDPQCGSDADDDESPGATLTIRYDAGTSTFRGAVVDSGEECADLRRLVLRRRTTDGSRLVARTFTDGRSNWKVYWPRAAGRYFAVAPEVTVNNNSGSPVTCERLSSITIRVRSR